MPLLCKYIQVMKHGVKRRRHGPKRSHGNIPSICEGNGPAQLNAADNHGRRRLELIEEPIKGLFHVRHDGFVESGKIGGFVALVRDDVGDGREANGFRLGIGADETEPLLGDHEGYENLVGSS
ncbi:hypothetical protein V8G54_037538 [Vigna mungo]|uniref:Uncharacterized protein n=1 Tax=Vigna mungo TaxID=3915 RepID=A0AAQ3RGK8_VIGMU